MTFKVIVPGCTATEITAKSRKEARRIVEDAKRAEVAMYRRTGHSGWADHLAWTYFSDGWVIYEA